MPLHRVARSATTSGSTCAALALGIQGWLVKTGRFRKEDLGRGIWPDRVLDSITDLNR